MTREPLTYPSNQLKEQYVRRLAEATGVSAVKADDLVDELGFDLPSLIREARLLKKLVS